MKKLWSGIWNPDNQTYTRPVGGCQGKCSFGMGSFFARGLWFATVRGDVIMKETSMGFRHDLGAVILSAALMGIAACDRSPGDTGTGSTAGAPGGATPNEQGPATSPSASNSTAAGGNTMGAGDVAATQPGASSSSRMPGLPSVNGTSVKGLSTADAAATRLIDEAKNAINRRDLSKARTLVGELQQKGMYDSLSAPVKSQVDELAMQAAKASPATQGQ
jgi:hypothetical protein